MNLQIFKDPTKPVEYGQQTVKQIIRWASDTEYEIWRVQDWLEDGHETGQTTWDDLEELDSAISKTWEAIKALTATIDHAKKEK